MAQLIGTWLMIGTAIVVALIIAYQIGRIMQLRAETFNWHKQVLLQKRMGDLYRIISETYSIAIDFGSIEALNHMNGEMEQHHAEFLGSSQQ